jgi:rhodanese-related sulfurtransferase
VKRIVLEGLWVAVLGAAVAFAANALSPRGLRLDRDYFHLTLRPQAAATNLNPGGAGAGTNSLTELLANLKRHGLQLIESNRVSRLYNDPRREAGLIIFVDARDEKDYQQGHIPGAYEFYNPYQEKYLASLGPICRIAQQVVVYCHGGDQCDDSLNTALTLRGVLGVPNENLFVYTGGFTEWRANGLPVETGALPGGQLLK